MRSSTTAGFRADLAALPEEVRRQARAAYRLFVRDRHHPSLAFKRLKPDRPVYSVRVGLNYRALGRMDGNLLIWFWIGPHAEYDGILRRM